MQSPRILLLEDDTSLGYILKEYLTMHGYNVTLHTSGESLLEDRDLDSYDLAILDIMLPGIDGYEVAARIKSKVDLLPFIFLSAKSLKIDKLKGFKIGADDYITKPVEEEILLAKIKVLIRNSNSVISVEENVTLGGITFKPQLQQLISKGNKVKQLTKTESDLLLLMYQHKNELLSRKKALKQIWGSTDEFSRKSMDVFISHLRKYLSSEMSIKIQNVHGQGFIFKIIT